MINKEDSEIRNKIHDLADRNKAASNREFPLDTSLDYSRESIFRVFNSDNGSVDEFEESSVAVVCDENELVGKGLGKDIDSYDMVIRVGMRKNDFEEFHVGGLTDLQILHKNEFIFQNIISEADVIVDDNEVPDVFYEVLEDETQLYLLTDEFVKFVNDFKDIHGLNEIPDYLFSVLLSLKLFDVVHFFGLDPYDVELEDLIFSFHFKGFISLKDLYE